MCMVSKGSILCAKLLCVGAEQKTKAKLWHAYPCHVFDYKRINQGQVVLRLSMLCVRLLTDQPRVVCAMQSQVMHVDRGKKAICVPCFKFCYNSIFVNVYYNIPFWIYNSWIFLRL